MRKRWIKLNEKDMKAQLDACKALYGTSPATSALSNDQSHDDGVQIKEKWCFKDKPNGISKKS